MGIWGLWGLVPSHCWSFIEKAFIHKSVCLCWCWWGQGDQKGSRLKGWDPDSLGEKLRPSQISLFLFHLQGNGSVHSWDIPMRGTPLCQKNTSHSPAEVYIKTPLLLGSQRAPETIDSQPQRSRGLSPNWRSCSLSLVWSLSTAPSHWGFTALSLARSWSRLSCRHRASVSGRERVGWGVPPAWSVSFPGQCFFKLLFLVGRHGWTP